jgi:methionyl-tRNA formyltransferase
MSLRVVVVTRIPPVLEGFGAVIHECGHEVVALLTNRVVLGVRGPADATSDLVIGAPEELDVLLPARRSSIAPLLAAVEPDLVVCMGFPWRIPPDALAVPRLGWLNGHPSLLPLHRGPVPVAWAIREGDEEIGITFHFMDAELDTGPILAQRRIPLGELEPPDDFYPKAGLIMGEALAEALARIDAGHTGTPQDPESGSYESFFTQDDVWLDLSRPAVELHRLAWAWRYGMSPTTIPGALLELDGTAVRVLATSLTEVEGARRVECGDAPLWLVETEELSEGEASRTTAPAPSTH